MALENEFKREPRARIEDRRWIADRESARLAAWRSRNTTPPTVRP
jgi:hypothetical protein